MQTVVASYGHAAVVVGFGQKLWAEMFTLCLERCSHSSIAIVIAAAANVLPSELLPTKVETQIIMDDQDIDQESEFFETRQVSFQEQSGV